VIRIIKINRFCHVTFSEIRSPEIVAPPGETTRARLVTNGGYIRKDSSIIAERYGSLAVLLNVISSAIENSLQISSESLRIAKGLLQR
jgi:hypothetical protein